MQVWARRYTRRKGSAMTLEKQRGKKVGAVPGIQAGGHVFNPVSHQSHFRPIKLQITLRVDSDVIAWFRENHPRYQTLMNAVLRKEMMNALAEERREKAEDGTNSY